MFLNGGNRYFSENSSNSLSNGYSNIVIFYFEIFASQKYKTTMVELEPLIRPFSPGSTLEPGLEVFHRHGPK
jgi:hypothetical protein